MVGVLETAVAVGMFCASTKRGRAEEQSPRYIVSSGLTLVPFRASSSGTLEGFMTDEIQDLPGVVSVSVKRDGTVFNVLVVMEDTDFDRFATVAQKKIGLYENFPNHTFNFDFITAESLHCKQETMLTSHAA